MVQGEIRFAKFSEDAKPRGLGIFEVRTEQAKHERKTTMKKLLIATAVAALWGTVQLQAVESANIVG